MWGDAPVVWERGDPRRPVSLFQAARIAAWNRGVHRAPDVQSSVYTPISEHSQEERSIVVGRAIRLHTVCQTLSLTPNLIAATLAPR